MEPHDPMPGIVKTAIVLAAIAGAAKLIGSQVTGILEAKPAAVQPSEK